MNVADRLRVGTHGLTSRRARTALSALGIALGITSLVAVMGLSQSSRANINAQLDQLGTNLLIVKPGQSLTGGSAPKLPVTAPAMIRRVPTVEDAASYRVIPNVSVRKSDVIPDYTTGGMVPIAADLNLIKVLNATLSSGRWLSSANAGYPVVVLGSDAAATLAAKPGQRVWIDGQWFAVAGVLNPVELSSDLDNTVLMGPNIAKKLYGNLSPSQIYTRIQDDSVVATRDILGLAANPKSPSEVGVTRPSDALAAKAAVDSSLTRLTLGLGAVSLLVGAVGIANVMIIAVLERRREIGVRRALGATRLDIASQFLTESTVMALLGGVIGVAVGLVITLGWSLHQGWLLTVPWLAICLGIGSALAVGSVVGMYPAVRAAAVPPTEALRSP